MMPSEQSFRPSTVLAAVLLCWSLAGCTVAHELALPARFHAVPGQDDVALALADARRHQDQGRSELALPVVEQLLRDHPNHVDVNRVRQDLLRQRGRLGLVLREAEDRLDRQPGAAAQYLSGRVQSEADPKQQAFRRAIDLDPELFWGWFGLAFTLRTESPQAANEIYQYLYQRTDKEQRTAIAYASSLLQSGHPRRALKVYQQLRSTDSGLGSLGIAQTQVRSGHGKGLWSALLQALRHRPFDGGVRAVIAVLLSRGLSDDRIQHVLDVLRRDPLALAEFERLHGSLLAALWIRAGDPVAALSALRAAWPLDPPDRFVYRNLLISTGDLAGLLADLRLAAKEEFLSDEGNQVMGRWRALFDGSWMTANDPIEDPSVALALARALVDVGYLEFAERLAGRVLLRHRDSEAAAQTLDHLRQLRSGVRREMAFESGMRRILRHTYAAHKKRKTESLDQVLVELKRLSMRVLGRDVIGAPDRFTLPFVGVLIDSLGPGLPAHLARYNKHLVMGQRNGGPVEAMILTRLSLRHVDPVEGMPLPPHCTEVVGEHRQLDPMEQADLAGIALLNHYVVDMDEVRSWAGRIAERRRIGRQDGAVLLRDALPRRADALESAGVEWRLSLLSSVEDNELESAVLDMIRWHERGHMVDFLHYLPVGMNPLRSLALVVRNGLDSLQVTAEMEGRAQLAALAMSPHTELVLAHTAGFLSGAHGNSPHAIGFRSMVSQLQAELQRRQVPHAEVSRWHLLDPGMLRETARTMLQGLW